MRWLVWLMVVCGVWAGEGSEGVFVCVEKKLDGSTELLSCPGRDYLIEYKTSSEGERYLYKLVLVHEGQMQVVKE